MNKRLGKYLSGLTKPELEKLRELLNLTEEEEKVFDCLSKGKSKIQTAEKCMVCPTTIDYRIKAINLKLNRING